MSDSCRNCFGIVLSPYRNLCSLCESKAEELERRTRQYDLDRYKYIAYGELDSRLRDARTKDGYYPKF